MYCFQTVRFKNVLLTENCVSISAMKMLAKGNCCLCAHHGSVVLSIEVERIFFEN